MATRFGHTNLIVHDWRRMTDFYCAVFNCVPLQPERALDGAWLGQAIGLEGASLTGIHLRLPGWGDEGPTLELFTYPSSRPRIELPQANTPGFGHIAFQVDDVPAMVAKVLQHGGSELGEVVQCDIPGLGALTFVYVRDPEGNIVELQRWG